jgi:hypothetical protein
MKMQKKSLTFPGSFVRITNGFTGGRGRGGRLFDNRITIPRAGANAPRAVLFVRRFPQPSRRNGANATGGSTFCPMMSHHAALGRREWGG